MGEISIVNVQSAVQIKWKQVFCVFHVGQSDAFRLFVEWVRWVSRADVSNEIYILIDWYIEKDFDGDV